MAYKVFSNGDALTGAELNTYLMNQSVIQFASTTARDAAIPSPAEGQLVWLQDVNKYVYYTGSAWADLITPASSGNAIINGAFDIWQRGTSFSNPASSAFNADRWHYSYDGTGATRTVSQQTFTPGTAPVSGYEGAYFLRHDLSAAGSGNTTNVLNHKIEDVRTFAGQTATLSFWAKANATRSVSPYLIQNFGSGGSSSVNNGGSAISIGTSWARYSLTVSMASIAGKTIGTGSFVHLYIDIGAGGAFTFDIWGVQLESGSTATPFKRNASNIQGELAACQRYYYRITADTAYGHFGGNFAASSTSLAASISLPVTMRVVPTAIDYSSNLAVNDGAILNAVSSITLGGDGTKNLGRASATSSGMTTYRFTNLIANNNATSYIGFSAEL